MSGFSISSTVASMISLRLCGGMLVAMPTAMPLAPLTSRLGIRDGSTTGSSRVWSKFGMKSTVSFSRSARISSLMLGQARFGVPHGRRRIAVHRAEVSLPVDQRVAHVEILRQAHQRRDKSRLRRAGDSCRKCRRRSSRTCDSRDWTPGPGRSWRPGCAAAPASGRRARRESRAPRSRSSRNRGTTSSSRLQYRPATMCDVFCSSAICPWLLLRSLYSAPRALIIAVSPRRSEHVSSSRLSKAPPRYVKIAASAKNSLRVRCKKRVALCVASRTRPPRRVRCPARRGRGGAKLRTLNRAAPATSSSST